MRKDAQARRDHLIEVAADLFEQDGYEIPLETIAEKAGVGRGTLYRNFRDRSALVIEVLKLREGQFHRYTEALTSPKEAFVTWMKGVGVLSALYSPVFASLDHGDEHIAAEWGEIQTRHQAFYKTVLHDAIAAGEISDSVGPEDMHLLALMMAGVGEGTPAAEREKALDQAVELLLAGLETKPGTQAD
jgi:Transcriptional regulator